MKFPLNIFLYSPQHDASILVYKFRPKRTGFNVYAEYTRPQLTFLALNPWYIACVLPGKLYAFSESTNFRPDSCSSGSMDSTKPSHLQSPSILTFTNLAGMNTFSPDQSFLFTTSSMWLTVCKMLCRDFLCFPAWRNYLNILLSHLINPLSCI